MPRKVHFAITNNPLAKDKEEKQQEPWAYTSCEGGYWHSLEEVGGKIRDEWWYDQLNNELVIIMDHPFIPITLPNRRLLIAFAVRTPKGRIWDSYIAHTTGDGWDKHHDKFLKSTRTEPVTGPRW